MRQLLGEYFGRFQSTAVVAHQQSPGQHRQFHLAQPDLVILSSGRLRNFRGIAYLPTLLPAGVSGRPAAVIDAYGVRMSPAYRLLALLGLTVLAGCGGGGGGSSSSSEQQ